MSTNDTTVLEDEVKDFVTSFMDDPSVNKLPSIRSSFCSLDTRWAGSPAWWSRRPRSCRSSVTSSWPRRPPPQSSEKSNLLRRLSRNSKHSFKAYWCLHYIIYVVCHKLSLAEIICSKKHWTAVIYNVSWLIKNLALLKNWTIWKNI